MTATITGNGIDKVQDGSIQAADLAAGVPARSNLPAGTVLQVVSATITNTISTSSTSFSDTGLSATITPISTSSKILVLCQANGIYNASGLNGTALQLVRNTTAILMFECLAGYMSTTEKSVGGSSTSYLDSPATTSATTYKLQIASSHGGTVYFNATGASRNSAASITLMEIAA